jgi:PAS domain S-box-containing protein
MEKSVVPRVPQTWLARYSFALAATAVALTVRAFFSPLLGNGAPYILLLPFVTLSAWYGGFGPGIFATCLGAVAGVFLYVDPTGQLKSITPRDGVLLFLFIFGCGVTSWICGALRRAHLHEQELATARKAALDEAQVAAKALKESEIQFRSLFENALDAVLIANDRGEYVDANPAACHLLGCEKSEALSKAIFDFIQPEKRPAAEEAWKAFTEQGEQRGVIELCRADGKLIEAEFSAKAHFLPGRHLSVLRDITDRWNAEVERARLLEQETRARREAEESSRLKDEFLATVSHELRTPLTAMLGWTHLLETEGLDSQISARAIQAIDRNARSQAQLVEDLLDVSRIITGKLRLKVEAVDPALLLESAFEAVSAAAEVKEIEIIKTTGAGGTLITGDPARLQQILWNLLANAIKFTPRKGRVEVRVERIESNIVITVSDNGIGIDPDFLPFVFDRFRQADGSTTRHHGGLGLGLSIVRHLVDLHGGQVEAMSAGQGRGSTFKVSFPSRDIESKYIASKSVNRDGRNALDSGLSKRLHGMKILVVDDDVDTISVMRVILEGNGAEVRTAGSGKGALQEINRSVPDVLVCDIGMAEMDGYEVIRMVRALAPENGGTMPALALTAYARPEDKLHALTSGFQMHLSKPTEPGELIAALGSLIQKT